MRYYLSIEKSVEGFELYKPLWLVRGVYGIRANTMAEGIEKAIEIEQSKTDELYFIDIVASEIDYMPQLHILSSETEAPILIAASKPDADERKEALNNGADYYGEYCETTTQNIDTVIASINSLSRRVKKKRQPSKVLVYKNLLIAPGSLQVFANDKHVSLNKLERAVLRCLMENKDRVVPMKEILRKVWGKAYEHNHELLWRTVNRLRKKLSEAVPESDYIVFERDEGYILR